MQFKAYPISMLKVPNAVESGIDDTGTFEAIVSVFGNVDSDGDVVEPGAYADTLDAWESSTNVLPVLWSHRMDDPRFNIGAIHEAAEVTGGDARIPDTAHPWVQQHGGLWVRGQLDTDGDAAVAKAAHRLMLARRTTQFSFAYDVLDSERDTKSGVNRLRKLWLYEVSLTQVGANQLTDLGAAKTAAVEEDDDGEEEETPDSDTAGNPRPVDVRLRCEIAAFTHQYG